MDVLSVFGALIIFLSSLVAAFYFYMTVNYNYWKKRNVKFVKPSFPFGSVPLQQGLNYSVSVFMKNIYDQIQGRYGGFFLFNRPFLMIKDPDLIKLVLMKHFDVFRTRGVYFNFKQDPFACSLLTSSGEIWRYLRYKLSPAFAPYRLRSSLENEENCMRAMVNTIDESLAQGKENFNILDLIHRYIIMLSAKEMYGVDVNPFENKNDEFTNMINQSSSPNLNNFLRIIFAVFFPFLKEKFNVKLFKPSCTNYIKNELKAIIRNRDENNIRKKDFIQILSDLLKTEKNMDLEKITGQPFAFILASYELLSLTITHCLYDLARAPELQRKGQQSVDEALQKHDGIFTYDAIKEMKYIHYCIDETLRLRPPISIIIRRCCQDFKIPNSDLIIKKDDNIFISNYSIHMDPKYYKNPEIYDPERFSPERNEIVSGTYLPFGDGPKFCIGKSFSNLICQVCLAKLLSRYYFELSSDVPKEIEYRAKYIFTSPKFAINLKITKRQNDL